VIALPKYKTSFWGQSLICRPYLISKIFGDGAELVTFQYMDDRPDYYVARVPSGTLMAIDDQTDVWYDVLMPDIVNQIDDEATDFYTERNWRERDRKGYVCVSRRWPIPPGEASGSSWGEFSPSDDDKAVIFADTREQMDRKFQPLFIPLCAGPFDEFKAGSKQNMEEYRPEGPRWNAEVCRIGRRVVLSRGYGKKDRLQGVIVGYRQIWSREVPNWSTYYPKKEGRVAAIKIEVEGKV